jgi:hypothetical protein
MARRLDTPNFDAAMVELGNRFVEIIRDSLMKEYPYAPGFNKDRKSWGKAPLYASGDLYNSVEAQYDTETKGLDILMNYYWEYVDRGRGPGSYAPIRPLIEWATLKGFEDPKSAAFGISTNIKKFGIRGTQFFSMIATDQIINDLEEYLSDQLGIDLETFFEAMSPKSRPV